MKKGFLAFATLMLSTGGAWANQPTSAYAHTALLASEQVKDGAVVRLTRLPAGERPYVQVYYLHKFLDLDAPTPLDGTEIEMSFRLIGGEFTEPPSATALAMALPQDNEHFQERTCDYRAGVLKGLRKNAATVPAPTWSEDDPAVAVYNLTANTTKDYDFWSSLADGLICFQPPDVKLLPGFRSVTVAVGIKSGAKAANVSYFDRPNRGRTPITSPPIINLAPALSAEITPSRPSDRHGSLGTLHARRTPESFKMKSVEGRPLDIGRDLAGDVLVAFAGPGGPDDRISVGFCKTTFMPEERVHAVRVSILNLPLAAPIIAAPGTTEGASPIHAVAGWAFDDKESSAHGKVAAAARLVRAEFVKFKHVRHAFGIVKAGGTDASFVRVSCRAAAAPCEVRLECLDQDGLRYGGPLLPTPAGATTVWSSDRIADALGGGWTKGRGRCAILSDAPLGVQHMVRSGGVLINSTMVDGIAQDGLPEPLEASAEPDGRLLPPTGKVAACAS